MHEPRTDADRLTDHSALTVALALDLDLEPVAPLTVTDPGQVQDPIGALFSPCRTRRSA